RRAGAAAIGAAARRARPVTENGGTLAGLGRDPRGRREPGAGSGDLLRPPGLAGGGVMRGAMLHLGAPAGRRGARDGLAAALVRADVGGGGAAGVEPGGAAGAGAVHGVAVPVEGERRPAHRGAAARAGSR